MWFVTLVKFRRTPTKADTEAMKSRWAEGEKMGVKRHSAFWTLGRFDAVIITEAPDEKAMMKFQVGGDSNVAHTETLVAVSRDEAVAWLK